MSFFFQLSSDQSLCRYMVCKTLNTIVFLGLVFSIDMALADDKLLIPNGMQKYNAKSAKFYSPSQIILESSKEKRANINFYACKFDYVTTFNELIEQFYLNLGGDCLEEISTEKLAHALGVNITEKRLKERIVRVKDSHIKGIEITRMWHSYVIEATAEYLEEHGSLFKNNILPSSIPSPLILITFSQPDDNMKGDLLNIRYIAEYSWTLPALEVGSVIRFSHNGDGVIKKITISW